MKRALVTAIWLLPMVSACYDLTFNNESHTVTDFQVLAIHVEPPELRPDTPMTADVLYADPAGGGPIRAAWSIRLYDRSADSERKGFAVVAPNAPEQVELQLPAPAIRLAEKTSEPLLLFEVYLCHGGFVDPSRIGVDSAESLLHTLCTEGEPASGVKFISAAQPGFPQNNPRISRVELNGVYAAAEEEGGGPFVLCSAASDCASTVEIRVDLDPDSIDLLLPEGTLGADAGALDADAGAELLWQYTENHRVDWFVTGGSIVHEGLFAAAWSLPEESAGEWMLYVIARDVRGGNDWKTFRVRKGD